MIGLDEGKVTSWAAGSALSIGVLLVGSAAVTLAICAGPAKPASHAMVLILGCAVLVAATLLAPPLPRDVPGGPQAARRRAALVWAGVVAGLTGLAAAIVAGPASGLWIAALLLPMIVILQSLLGAGVPRPLLDTGIALALAAPVWLSPLAELAGSESGIAGWIALLSPLTHLAAAAGCDYLHADWMYAHSALSGLQRVTPSPLAITLCYVAIAAALTAATADYSHEAMQESVR